MGIPMTSCPRQRKPKSAISGISKAANYKQFAHPSPAIMDSPSGPMPIYIAPPILATPLASAATNTRQKPRSTLTVNLLNLFFPFT